jgi:hypothetical protein
MMSSLLLYSNESRAKVNKKNGFVLLKKLKKGGAFEKLFVLLTLENEWTTIYGTSKTKDCHHNRHTTNELHERVSTATTGHA